MREETANLITPTINLNGSDREYLIKYRRDAMDHLQDAVEALAQVTPHGRDYPADYDQCLRDRETHFIRIQAIKALREAIYAEAVAIQQQ
jgi:hypothetical protein